MDFKKNNQSHLKLTKNLEKIAVAEVLCHVYCSGSGRATAAIFSYSFIQRRVKEEVRKV